MKYPLTIIIIKKDPLTEKETHYRYDTVSGFPRLGIFKMFFKFLFTT